MKYTRTILLVVFLTCLPPSLALSKPPNILIILADDCTFSDLPVYGGKNAATPNIDRLAMQGLTFNRAYLSSAMCQPCRAELYTGLFPMRNGCAWNHSACRPEIRGLPHYLSQAGYRTGIAGKVHVEPKECFPFEAVNGFDDNAVRDPTQAHSLSGISDFMKRNPAQPFCLVVALTEPHVPWVMGDATKFPPRKISLPGNIADTPKTREDFSKYLAEMNYMDGQVGEILQTLDQSGMANETLVLFSSEQGSQFPGNKWTCWDTGLHTALIARWPSQVAAGSRTDAIVHYADVLPTILDLASVIPEQPLDGISFVSVLRGTSNYHRKYAYGFHNNIPEGPHYPIRSISDGKWRYIRNLSPDEVYIEKHMMGLLGGNPPHNPYWSSWLATASDNQSTYKLVKRFMHRPAEQLYHTEVDPFELNDLASDPQQAETLKGLREELDRWLAQQKDPGPKLDTVEAHGAGKRRQHIFP